MEYAAILAQAMQSTDTWLTNAFNARFSRKSAKQAAARQWDFWKKSYNYSMTEGPALQKEGYEKAGLNPALMYGNGVNYASAMSSAPQASSPNAQSSGIGEGLAEQLGPLFGEAKEQAKLDTKIKEENLRYQRDETLSHKLDTAIKVCALTGRIDPEVGRLLERHYLDIEDPNLDYDDEGLRKQHDGAAVQVKNAHGQWVPSRSYTKGQAMRDMNSGKTLSDSHEHFNAAVNRQRLNSGSADYFLDKLITILKSL